MLKRSIVLSLGAGVALSNLIAARGEPGHQGTWGGGPRAFLTGVPDHDLDVILARPTLTSVTLSVAAARDITAALSYEPGAAPRLLSLEAGVPQEIEITGLSPNQSYRYTIAAGAPLATGTFRTARTGGAPFTFAVQAGSYLDGSSDARVYTNTLTNILADRPDFLLDLGDRFTTEKDPACQNAARQYLAQRYYLGLAGRTVPIFHVLGHRDGEAGWRARATGDMTARETAARQKYFPLVRPDDFYSASPAPNAGYAWIWGDALFIVLDPSTETGDKARGAEDGWAWTLGRAQYDWLRQTLDASHAPQTFVFIRDLVAGSSREARGDAEPATFFEWGGLNPDGTPGFAAHRPGWPMPIHDLLSAHDVSVVFHGNDRWYVQQQRDGVVYQEVPRPGHLRASVSADAAIVEYVKSHLRGRNAEVTDRYTITTGQAAREPMGGLSTRP